MWDCQLSLESAFLSGLNDYWKVEGPLFNVFISFLLYLERNLPAWYGVLVTHANPLAAGI
jgi:hypothetical protein